MNQNHGNNGNDEDDENRNNKPPKHNARRTNKTEDARKKKKQGDNESSSSIWKRAANREADSSSRPTKAASQKHSGKDAKRDAGRGRGRGGGRQGRNNRNQQQQQKSLVHPHWLSLPDCEARYHAKDPNLIRGTLRSLPVRDATGFCTCDRGSLRKDVVLEGPLECNRAMDGDMVFVELLPLVETQEETKMEPPEQSMQPEGTTSSETMMLDEGEDEVVLEEWWQDDPNQMSLWDPLVPIPRRSGIQPDQSDETAQQSQRKGRVVCIVPPKALATEIKGVATRNKALQVPHRRIVGTLKRLSSGGILLTSANKCLPQFRLSRQDADKFREAPQDAIFQAKYIFQSWQRDCQWPPCCDVQQFGMSCNVQDETMALLIDNQVDHGDFPQSVLEECQEVVASGEFVSPDGEPGWKPTPEMYRERRDFRKRRIFTIDPTTAKDLDDALHIEDLGNGQIELGVHIAGVSYFVQPDSQIDREALRRCTTVYLVDRTIPMLPRPLCEIACSLNENVERLAFSCVWRMNMDGSLVKGHNVWYGRSVIKSCARLDYATAQNIIENKVACGEAQLDEELWPAGRRPTGGHTIEQVAVDVRLMHRVAMARRRLRFQNGAVALNAVKLTFQLGGDRETPLLCQPYKIRDSNRLVEEYMLLANYLVAQRMITHAHGRALLRNHEPPVYEGLEKVVEMAQETLGFRFDISSSEALQRSLNRLSRECDDELILQCITEMLKLPMRAATYVAAGEMSNAEWAHFALNIPYYTHFTSPIRRYADVIVHRLLQATLDGEQAVNDFCLSQKEIAEICQSCNDKKEGSRKAQERSDVVFLALYLKRQPMKSQLGVVLSVGQKAFTVFIPGLGVSALVFLEEHKQWIDAESIETNIGRRIRLTRTTGHNGERWRELLIKNFTKVRVTCKCQDKPPISVKLEFEGPWTA